MLAIYSVQLCKNSLIQETREFAILIVTLPFTVIGAPLYNGGPLDIHPTFVNNIIGEKKIRKCSYAVLD